MVRLTHRGRGRERDGFSMVELLIAIVLAGIIFAAMVPLFASALKKSSGDNLRVTSNNIAQDRIEQVRLLGGTASGYASITSTNLNTTSTTFGDGRFGPTYYLTGSNKPYHVSYTVTSHDKYTDVSVAVSWVTSSDTYTTKMDTTIKDPTANSNVTISGGSQSWSPQPGGYSLTASFKDWSDVTSAGVVVVLVYTSPTPRITATATPSKLVPNASSTTVTWTGLPGGPDINYAVTCHSTYGTFTSPTFHLLKSAQLKFDTHPGGS